MTEPARCPSVECVLPLKVTGRHYWENLGRTSILFASLATFLRDQKPHIRIIVPHDEFALIGRIARTWSGLDIEVVAEDVLLPQVCARKGSLGLRPWHFQQMIKLGAVAASDSDYVLLLDPDVFATRPFSVQDLFQNGRGLVHIETKMVHLEWWQASAELLGFASDTSSIGLGVTPQMLSASACRDLLLHLEQRHHVAWPIVLEQGSHRAWTEYSLYWTYCEERERLDALHVVDANVGRHLLSAESVWAAEEFSEAQVRRAFAPDGGIFCVVQSAAGISVDAVASIAADHVQLPLLNTLPPKAGAYERIAVGLGEKLRGGVRKGIFAGRTLREFVRAGR